MSPNLRELLATRVLIGDGAVGTLLGERGVGYPYARANLPPPDGVTGIHLELQTPARPQKSPTRS